MEISSHLRFCGSLIVFQLEARGLSVCCCKGVRSAQEGPEAAVLVDAATGGLAVMGALADAAGAVACAKPVAGKASRPAVSRPNDNNLSRKAQAPAAGGINKVGRLTGG